MQLRGEGRLSGAVKAEERQRALTAFGRQSHTGYAFWGSESTHQNASQTACLAVVQVGGMLSKTAPPTRPPPSLCATSPALRREEVVLRPIESESSYPETARQAPRGPRWRALKRQHAPKRVPDRLLADGRDGRNG
jgi:hypothetical protein